MAKLKLTWHIGDVVRKVRELRGFKTQKSLADAIPMRPNTLSDFERKGDTYGYEPDTLMPILEILKIDKAELYNLVPVERTDEESVTPPVLPVLDADTAAIVAKYRQLTTEGKAAIRHSVQAFYDNLPRGSREQSDDGQSDSTDKAAGHS